MDFSQIEVNFISSGKKRVLEEMRIEKRMEDRLEEELSMEKKETDSKVLLHWKELKQSEGENVA